MRRIIERSVLLVALLLQGGIGAFAGDQATDSGEQDRQPAAMGDVSSRLGGSGSPKWGPYLGLGAPHPLAVGARIRSSVEWDVEGEAGYFAVPLGSRSLGFMHAQVGGRWFPRGEGFHLDGLLGYQSIAIRGPIPITEQDGSVRFDSLYVAPRIGYEWRFRSGLTLGTQLGWQFPLIAAGVFDDGVTSDSRKSLGRIAGLPLPTLTLLQVGWLLDL